MSADDQSLRAVRATEVWRRHLSISRDMSGRRFWANMTFEIAASLAAAVCLILQLSLEPALWWRQRPWQGSQVLLGRMALGLLILAPVSGVLVERIVSHRTPPRTVLRPGGRLVLWLLGSLPMAGLFLIPLAKRWMAGTSALLRPIAVRLDLDAPPAALPRSSPRHWVYGSGAFGLWLAAISVLPPLAGCLWLAAGGERKIILPVCVALHVAQAGCLAIYAASDLRFTHASRRSLRLAPWFCLLPLPAPLLAMIPLLWAGAEARHQKTLTWSADAEAGTLRRHSQWLDLRRILQQRWQAGSWLERWTRPQGRELPLRHGRAEAARRTWVRAKALLLPVEASLAVGWLAPKPQAALGSAYDSINDSMLRPWLLATSLLAAVGLLQAAGAGLARLLRLRSPDLLGPPASGLYLFITQTALTFGLLAGRLAAHESFPTLAMLAAVSGAMAMVLSFLLMAVSSLTGAQPVSLVEAITWPLSLLLLGLLPVPLAVLPGHARLFVSVFTLLVLLSEVLLGVRFLPWVLYPFTLRHLFEQRLGQEGRVALVFSALITFLPLGGLALPYWVWARRGETPEQGVE